VLGKKHFIILPISILFLNFFFFSHNFSSLLFISYFFPVSSSSSPRLYHLFYYYYFFYVYFLFFLYVISFYFFLYFSILFWPADRSTCLFARAIFPVVETFLLNSTSKPSPSSMRAVKILIVHSHPLHHFPWILDGRGDDRLFQLHHPPCDQSAEDDRLSRTDVTGCPCSGRWTSGLGTTCSEPRRVFQRQVPDRFPKICPRRSVRCRRSPSPLITFQVRARDPVCSGRAPGGA